MDNQNDKKELAVREVPDIPKISDEKVELTGWQRYLHDWKIGKIERKELEEKRKIFAETRIQLLRDRTKEVIEAYRVSASAARETILRAAEEYVKWFFQQSEVRMGSNEADAIQLAINNYYDHIERIRPELPENLKELNMTKAREILDRTMDKIMMTDFKMEEALKRNYPKKKGFLDRFKS